MHSREKSLFFSFFFRHFCTFFLDKKKSDFDLNSIYRLALICSILVLIHNVIYTFDRTTTDYSSFFQLRVKAIFSRDQCRLMHNPLIRGLLMSALPLALSICLIAYNINNVLHVWLHSHTPACLVFFFLFCVLSSCLKSLSVRFMNVSARHSPHWASVQYTHICPTLLWSSM